MSVLIDDQVDIRRAAGATARARRLKLVDDRQRPCAQMRYVPARSGVPRQPVRPIAGASFTAVRSSEARSTAGRQQLIGADFKLSDRGLVMVMVGFALAVMLGAWVVVSQYLALVP